MLFDVTGVLMTPAESVGETYARLAAGHGVALPGWRLDDAFRRILGRMPARVFPDEPLADIPALEQGWWREVVRQTFQATDSTARFADFDRFFGALYDAFARASAWRLAPDAAHTLAGLRAAGLATGAVSNFDHRLPNLLEGLGIKALLDVVTIPAECGHAKPEPAIFASALASLGLAAEAAVYVGHDPEEDAPGAEAAGLQVLLLREGDTLSDLPARIQALATLGR